MNAPHVSRGRLTELDALRGLGALLVINFHYSTRFAEMFPGQPRVPFHIIGGNYRVMLFFAISGFAIFFSMAALRSGWDFVANRAVRLLPAYWAAMALTLVIEHLGHATALYIPAVDTLVNLSMLQGFLYIPCVDGAYWTLKYEIAFYACMLLLWLGFGFRHLERLILGWLALRLFGMLIWQDMPGRLGELLVLPYIPFFAIGMACYRVWKGQRRWRDQLPLLAAIVVTVAATETWDVTLWAALLVVIFWAMVEGWLGWLCLGPLLWVGRISYSLYLVHQHVGFTIMLNCNAAGLPPLVGYGLAIAAAFALGTLVHYAVERPAADWLSARWKRFRATRPPASEPVRVG